MSSKGTKKSLLASGLSLLASCALLAGTTFAWFTDSVTNTGNKIQAGKLAVELWNGEQNLTNSENPVFTYDKWEPGYSTGANLQVRNVGTLAVKYELELQNVIATKGIENVIDVQVDGAVVGTLADFMNGEDLDSGILKVGENSAVNAIVLQMQETAGNTYQEATATFDILLKATQAPVEPDGFDSSDYDQNAPLDFVPAGTFESVISGLQNGKPVSLTDSVNATAPITAPDGAKEIVINGNGHTISVNQTVSNSRALSLIAESGDDPGCAPDVNVAINGVTLEDTSTTPYSRGISFSNLNGAEITVTDSTVRAGYYALNFTLNNENVTVRFQNATIEGWAALNCYANNSTFIFENCVLSGQNDHSGPTNNFSIIVLDSNTLATPDNAGKFGSGNTLTFNNCEFLAKTTTENFESILSFQYGACNNTVNFNGCTFNYEPQDQANFINVDDDATGNRVFMDGEEILLGH